MKRTFILIGLFSLSVMISVMAYMVKDSVIYTAQKLFYPPSRQLEIYTGISLPKDSYILESHYQKDGSDGEVLYVKFMIEKSKADALFANRQHKLDTQNTVYFLDDYWTINPSNVQYCIWNPYTVIRHFGGIKTQRNVYFFVMYPEDNQVTVFCWIDKLGWGMSD